MHCIILCDRCEDEAIETQNHNGSSEDRKDVTALFRATFPLRLKVSRGLAKT